MKLSQRKQYAKQRLKKLAKDPLINISSRGYDNLFERNDGGKVGSYLMTQAKTNSLLKQGIKYGNTWDYWGYFVENGSYAGYQNSYKYED